MCATIAKIMNRVTLNAPVNFMAGHSENCLQFTYEYKLLARQLTKLKTVWCV